MNKNDIIETNIMVDDFLEHHGIKGMKWGVRRYQNADGSLTPEGQKRYNQFVSDVKRHGGKAGAIASVERSANNKQTAVGIASAAGFLGSVLAPMGAVASAPTFAAASSALLITPIGMLGTLAVSSIASNVIANNAQKKIADIKDIKEIADQYVDRPTVSETKTETSKNTNSRFDIAAEYYTKKGDHYAKKAGEVYDSGKTGIGAQAKLDRLEQKRRQSETYASMNAQRARETAVNKYKKEHPATKLSDNEIAANLGYEA